MEKYFLDKNWTKIVVFNMLSFSKKIEYGLIALRYMASLGEGELVPAKEISDKYRISYELLAKVLQKLTKAGIINSFYGVNGGYALAKPPDKIKLSEVIQALEGKSHINIVTCNTTDPESCDIFDRCTIKTPLSKIQSVINNMFNEISISEIL